MRETYTIKPRLLWLVCMVGWSLLLGSGCGTEVGNGHSGGEEEIPRNKVEASQDDPILEDGEVTTVEGGAGAPAGAKDDSYADNKSPESAEEPAAMPASGAPNQDTAPLPSAKLIQLLAAGCLPFFDLGADFVLSTTNGDSLTGTFDSRTTLKINIANREFLLSDSMSGSDTMTEILAGGSERIFSDWTCGQTSQTELNTFQGRSGTYSRLNIPMTMVTQSTENQGQATERQATVSFTVNSLNQHLLDLTFSLESYQTSFSR